MHDPRRDLHEHAVYKTSFLANQACFLPQSQGQLVPFDNHFSSGVYLGVLAFLNLDFVQ